MLILVRCIISFWAATCSEPMIIASHLSSKSFRATLCKVGKNLKQFDSSYDSERYSMSCMNYIVIIITLGQYRYNLSIPTS